MSMRILIIIIINGRMSILIKTVLNLFRETNE